MLLAAASAGTGCLETSRQAIRRLSPSYVHKRAQLRRIAEALPPPGSVRRFEVPRRLEPPIVIDEHTMEINTDVLPLETLLDPDGEAAEVDFWIYPNRLITCVQWMGPNNPLHPDELDKRAHGVADCELVLEQPYVLVWRTLRYDVPVAVAIEAFLVDLRSGAIGASFPLSWRGGYTAADLGRGPWAGEAREQAERMIWSAMRCGLVSALRAMPGARVRVRPPCSAKDSGARREPRPKPKPAVVVQDDAPGAPSQSGW